MKRQNRTRETCLGCWSGASGRTFSSVFQACLLSWLPRRCWWGYRCPQTFSRISPPRPAPPARSECPLCTADTFRPPFRLQIRYFLNENIFICVHVWNQLSSAAENIVPGNLACVSVVLAAIKTFAPSLAAFKAIALPIPRLAPVINRVLPASFLEENKKRYINTGKAIKSYLYVHYLVLIIDQWALKRLRSRLGKIGNKLTYDNLI